MNLARRTVLPALVAWAVPAAAHQLREWPRHRPAPPLRLPDLEGRPHDIAALRDHPLVLNFWASWCEPCRAEMPSLALMAQRHEAEGLRVLTINYQEPERAVRAFLEQLGTDLPVLMDRDGSVTSAWTSRLFPTTVLVARGGRPQRQVLGEVDWGSAEARGWITTLLARSR
ncbi:MAG: TlpA family protein disulfide reductase [Burkholderiales bacterium]|nr:TlpA family protein disulfide reductase [Burkholderiales bacterium]